MLTRSARIFSNLLVRGSFPEAGTRRMCSYTVMGDVGEQSSPTSPITV
jgi:hypothetical protein